MLIGLLTTSYPRSKDDISGIFIHNILEKTVHLNNNLQYQVIMPGESKIKKKEIWGNIQINRFQYFFPCSMQKLATDSGIPTDLSSSLMAKLQLPFFLLSFWWKTILCCRKCQVLHAHFFPCGVIALMANIFLRKKTLLTLHGTDYRMLLKYKKNRLLKSIIHKFDGIICLGNESLNFIKDLQYPEEKTFFSRIAVDTKKFAPTQKEARTKDFLRILWVGRIVPIKNIELLLEGIKYLLDKGIPLKLTIVGTGGEQKKMEEKAKKLKIDSNIEWVGQVGINDLPPYYQNTDLFVLTSDSEGLPSSMLEAMSCEKPVILTNVGSISDVVEYNKNGFLFEPKNLNEFTELLLKFIQLDHKTKKEIGKAAREKITAHFSIDNISNEHLNIYKAILGT
ncbi:MAG: hypothetical protein COA79_17070 [Planctomycetota bacterium]|nr:MAG: hypothetical protein COA79_17070 [Planctomycetota bacterium]